MLQCLPKFNFVFLSVVYCAFWVNKASQKLEIFPQLANQNLFWCFYYKPLSQFRKSFIPFALQPLILQSVFHLSYFSKHTTVFGSVWMCFISVNSHNNLCNSANWIIGLFWSVGIYSIALNAGLHPTHLSSVRLCMIYSTSWLFLKQRAWCHLEVSNCIIYEAPYVNRILSWMGRY